ncbi:SRPBCC domain-containing protein [Paenibacillus profundus]|uniref:SRPBCC domain-containing protein n=1 Tax=Paenibacillus profundus TaxID=1173085 RepID=A0ABS8YNP6_9BACL|nr:SRPBCC domain-containing protein [Paenibacillus profundus]MCE5172240.1 SRPBCC domain-containing protein [Paenibacillus profundus]
MGSSVSSYSPDRFNCLAIKPKKEMVDVELEPASNGTIVTLKHAGWQDSEEWLAAKEWHIQAWEQMLASLKSNMESDNGVLCCK